PGKWLSVVTKVETENKGAGKGMMHTVTFESMDPGCAGKVAKENYCMWVPVGAGRFKALLIAAGFSTFAGLRTSMLKGKTVLATVEREAFTGQDGKPATSAKVKAVESGAEAMKSLVNAPAAVPVAPVVGAQKVAF